jgi:hypothetical protein
MALGPAPRNRAQAGQQPDGQVPLKIRTRAGEALGGRRCRSHGVRASTSKQTSNGQQPYGLGPFAPGRTKSTIGPSVCGNTIRAVYCRRLFLRFTG